ncbi:hypothetical protein E1N52_04615 [Paraburkholderia guartelaensis]|uniref:Uncharacterized protein n=1 Tax=Paraburkholderia guartelaensis TaxID=2546446 RepID=A0A4R5LJH6_9BURK|nr:hypothetical protein E1N52_04615 [Paraburkholderia guartelaensis]
MSNRASGNAHAQMKRALFLVACAIVACAFRTYAIFHGFAKSPGQEYESNWLPAPAGPFSLYIRAYWGKQPILDASWKPPQIRKHA